MKEMGNFVVSCDPIYEYSKDMIRQREYKGNDENSRRS